MAGSDRERIREKIKRDRERELRREKARKALVFGAILLGIAALVVAIVSVVKMSDGRADADYELGDSKVSERFTEDPYLTFGAKSDAPVVDVYLDFTCPYCGDFHSQSGPKLEKQATDEEITLRVHPRTFLAANTSTKYSTRAAIAFAEVYKESPADALKYMDLLFENQPREGSKGLSNEKLQSLAEDAGSSADVTAAINEGRYRNWLSTTVEGEAQANTQGTPYVLVDGKHVEDWQSTEAIETAIEGAK